MLITYVYARKKVIKMEKFEEQKVKHKLFEILNRHFGEKGYELEGRLYHDYGIYGDDVDEFLKSVQDEFQTDFSSMVFSKYFPYEGFNISRDLFLLLKIFGVKMRSHYVPITLSDILLAIKNGSWTETAR